MKFVKKINNLKDFEFDFIDTLKENSNIKIKLNNIGYTIYISDPENSVVNNLENVFALQGEKMDTINKIIEVNPFEDKDFIYIGVQSLNPTKKKINQLYINPLKKNNN